MISETLSHDYIKWLLSDANVLDCISPSIFFAEKKLARTVIFLLLNEQRKELINYIYYFYYY